MKRFFEFATRGPIIAVVTLLVVPSLAQAQMKALKIINNVSSGLKAAKTVHDFVQSRKGSQSNNNYGNNYNYGNGGFGGLSLPSRNYGYPNTYPQQYQTYGVPMQTYAATPTYGGPKANTLPQTSSAVPQGNVLPNVATPTLAAQTVSNVGFQRSVVSLTQADVDRMRSELSDRNRNLLDRVQRDLDDVTSPAIDRLVNAAELTSAARTHLRDTVNRGDAAGIRSLLDPRDFNSPAARALVGLANAQQHAAALADGMNLSTMDAIKLANFVTSVRNLLPQDTMAAIASIASNQQVLGWLEQAVIGTNAVPTDDNTPVALIPGLEAGVMIPLGFGPTLVGLGQPGDQIILGSGNPLELAGLATPEGAPVAEAGEGTKARVILSNAGAGLVNYNVNDAPFSMESKFEQELTTGSSWIVEFDRGGNNGTARYTLTDGYYEFTPTATGWELYKKTFRVTIHNGNNFDFNFVADDQQKLLASRQDVELTGAFPVVVRFEDGTGQIKQKRLSNGKFEIAVAGGNNLDLFAASATTKTPARTGTSGSRTSAGLKLPAGFRSVDPMAGLNTRGTSAAVDSRLPPSFSLFSTSASMAPQASAAAR